MSDTNVPAAPPIPSGQLFQFMPQCGSCPHYKFSMLAGEIAQGKAPLWPVITLRAAIDEVIAAKKTAALRPHSIQVMSGVLNQFAQGREEATLESITAKQIEDWLARLKVKPCTKQSNVTRLSSLFSYHNSWEPMQTGSVL